MNDESSYEIKPPPVDEWNPDFEPIVINPRWPVEAINQVCVRTAVTTDTFKGTCKASSPTVMLLGYSALGLPYAGLAFLGGLVYGAGVVVASQRGTRLRREQAEKTNHPRYPRSIGPSSQEYKEHGGEDEPGKWNSSSK